MLISVLIPNFNHARFLQKRIDSVLAQDYENFEVIILDDASTDNSVEIIEAYRQHPRVSHVIYNSQNSGSAFKQWQRGLTVASGQYVWIAESDDWASHNFLSTLSTALHKNINIGICFCGSLWMDDKGNGGNDLSIYHESFFREGTSEIRQSLVRFNTIQNASSAILKKDLAEKYIGKAVQYKSCGDWRLYIDILSESNLLFVSDKLNFFRWYHNNTSNKAYKQGLWIREGLHILCSSKASKLSYPEKELVSLKSYWNKKPSEYQGFIKWKLKVLVQAYWTLFIRKQSRRAS